MLLNRYLLTSEEMMDCSWAQHSIRSESGTDIVVILVLGRTGLM